MFHPSYAFCFCDSSDEMDFHAGIPTIKAIQAAMKVATLPS